MRVQNDRPSRNALGGWLHNIDANHPKVEWKPERREPPKINATKLMAEFKAGTTMEMRAYCAEALGVTRLSLEMIGASWAKPYGAWAFPMHDEWGNPVGVRLRDMNGRKWAVTGSRSGIFLPDKFVEPQQTAWVVEGPTDEAAALSLGLYAVGRPSCSACDQEIVQAFRRLKVRRAVIISDNDSPGITGAEKLSKALRIPTALYIPPGKDLREAINLGLTRAMIESSVRNMVWKCP